MDPIFPGFPGDLALFTAEEVTQLKELGVLTPPPMPEHLPLFPPLVTPSRGRVVSTTLGAPPPETKTEGMRQSLMTDQDEESVLSDSYSDCLSSTADTSIMWERHLGCIARNRNHGPQSARIKTVADPVTRTAIRIAMGNVRSPGRGTSDMVQTKPVDVLHDAGTATMIAAAPISTDVRMGMTAASMTTK